MLLFLSRIFLQVPPNAEWTFAELIVHGPNGRQRGTVGRVLGSDGAHEDIPFLTASDRASVLLKQRGTGGPWHSHRLYVCFYISTFCYKRNAFDSAINGLWCSFSVTTRLWNTTWVLRGVLLYRRARACQKHKHRPQSFRKISHESCSRKKKYDKRLTSCALHSHNHNKNSRKP